MMFADFDFWSKQLVKHLRGITLQCNTSSYIGLFRIICIVNIVKGELVISNNMSMWEFPTFCCTVPRFHGGVLQVSCF